MSRRRPNIGYYQAPLRSRSFNQRGKGFGDGEGSTVDELVVTASPTPSQQIDLTPPIQLPSFNLTIPSPLTGLVQQQPATGALSPALPIPLTTTITTDANAFLAWLLKMLKGLKVSVGASGGAGGIPSGVTPPGSVAGAAANPGLMMLAAGAGVLVLATALATSGHSSSSGRSRRRRR